MTRAYIGLGANLGDREASIRRAAELIGAERLSTIRETEPWGLREQPRFLNAVAELDTGLSARELLARLLAVELELGRVRTGPRWGPRAIDLDLLLYGAARIDEEGLTVPASAAPRAAVRARAARRARPRSGRSGLRRGLDLLARLQSRT